MKYFLLLFTLLVYNVYAATDYIPEQAFKFKPIIKNELDNYFPELCDYNYVPSLVEHESCIYLKHKKCWNSFSELKTSREQGSGLLQITRAFNSDGSTRFDSLSNMRNNYKQELKDASWSTIKSRPDIQIRMGVLMLRDDYKKLYFIPSETERLKMTDSAYNGGLRDVLRSRRACGLAANCNPNIWFNNIEKYSVKSRRILYGNRSALDINNHHVRDVFLNKIPKYDRDYFNEEPSQCN